MVTFYIAATDRMSWGRGTREWEAIARSISHGGSNVKKVILFELTCPDGTTENDIHVNEMGSIVAPKGTEVKEFGNYDAVRMTEKFLDFTAEVDSISYMGGDDEA